MRGGIIVYCHCTGGGNLSVDHSTESYAFYLRKIKLSTKFYKSPIGFISFIFNNL